MRAMLLLALLAAACLTSACLVTAADGTYDCVGEPLTIPGGVVMTVHCYPVLTARRP